MFLSAYRKNVLKPWFIQTVFHQPAFQVAVVIPVYKEQMNESEQISFQQCIRILAKHPIFIVAPEDLNLNVYLRMAPEITIVRFAPAYFEGINGYNQLMLSLDFYEQFKNYRYTLIHQLDCFVFKDELNFWCEQGYDYIGAPWIDPDAFNAWTYYNRYKNAIEKKFSRYEILFRKILPKKTFGESGNGGLSLRKNKKFILILRLFSRQARKWSNNEDHFWAMVAPLLNPFFKVAGKRTSMRFSVEAKPTHCLEQMQGELPFGCHAWEKHEPSIWEKFLNQHRVLVQYPIKHR